LRAALGVQVQIRLVWGKGIEGVPRLCRSLRRLKEKFNLARTGRSPDEGWLARPRKQLKLTGSTYPKECGKQGKHAEGGGKWPGERGGMGQLAENISRHRANPRPVLVKFRDGRGERRRNGRYSNYWTNQNNSGPIMKNDVRGG